MVRHLKNSKPYIFSFTIFVRCYDVSEDGSKKDAKDDETDGRINQRYTC